MPHRKHIIQAIRGATIMNGGGDGIMTIVGVIRVDALLPDKYTVPYWDPKTGSGYQRQISITRVNALAKALRKGRVELPTAILLNLRDVNPKSVITESDGFCELDLQKVERFYVVDGQHRVEALRQLRENSAELDSGDWRNFKVPFVCMIGASKMEEMKQFHIVNSTAKSVPTDLSMQLLKERAIGDRGFMDELVEKGEDWKTTAADLVKRLADSSEIWKGRIKLPNMRVSGVPSASFVTSLQAITHNNETFKTMTDRNQQMQIIDAYWKGIAKCYPAAFKNRDEYTVCTGLGVRVLNGLLPLAFEIVRSQKQSAYSADAYATVLKEPLSKIDGANRDDVNVIGEDFWRKGSAGAAGSYAGGAGMKTLTNRLRRLFPQITVE